MIVIHVRDPRWKARLKPYCKTVEAVCAAVLKDAKRGRGEMAVVLADDAFVRDLNKTFRGKDKPTNVLSFPGEEEALGDIVLALETIAREADKQGKTFRDHATHLLVHGMLHLLGFDHARAKDAAAMEKREIKILKTLGVANPYLSQGHTPC